MEGKGRCAARSWKSLPLRAPSAAKRGVGGPFAVRPGVGCTTVVARRWRCN